MMMSDSHRAMMRTYGTLLGRVLIGFLFVVTGLGILFGESGVAGFSGMIASFGLPFATLLAWLVLAIKILGGAALILGYRVGCASAFLILFLLATIVFVHGKDPANDVSFFKNLAILGGLLYVIAYGPGEGWSLGKHRTTAPAAPSEM